MDVTDLLPGQYRNLIASYMTDSVREIRFRIGRECVLCGQNNVFVKDFKPSAEDVRKLLLHLCDYALYAHEEQLKSGYMTLSGGHRVGIAGSFVTENGKPVRLSDVQSLCIRVARQIPVRKEVSDLFFAGKEPLSSLILSPPGMGKTTLLREIAKIAGDNGIQTAIADERGELAACFRGEPQLDVGKCTDVMENLPKSAAIPMLVRAMSPRLIVCDEIGSMEDKTAIEEAVRCGCKVLCSAHGNGIPDAKKRHNLSGLLQERVFDRIVVLGVEVGRVCGVYDGEGKPC